MKFVPDCMKVPGPTIELIKEPNALKSRIKYPDPDPFEYKDDEYYTDEELERYDSE